MDVKLVLVWVILANVIANGTLAVRVMPKSLRGEVGTKDGGETSSETNGGDGDCKTSLMELKRPCSHKFAKLLADYRQTNLGHDCCQSIQAISRNCSPQVLAYLGLKDLTTAADGYCGGSSAFNKFSSKFSHGGSRIP